jgi:hypothetical protein
MRRNSFLAALLGAACTAAGAAGPIHFGEPLPADAVPVPLATALADPDTYAQSPHAIQGEITKVCQDKGCWTIIRDGSAWARVSTGHRYFLPKDASGVAVAYGRLVRKELDARTVEHLNAEGGEAQAQEFGIDALSISIEAAAEGTP